MCNGIFREPYTVHKDYSKCFHTFCKSCLHKRLSNNEYNCPVCDTYLGTDPAKAALPDRTLQTIIDKVLFPDMAAKDDEAEELFYQKRGISKKPLPGTDDHDDDEDEDDDMSSPANAVLAYHNEKRRRQQDKATKEKESKKRQRVSDSTEQRVASEVLFYLKPDLPISQTQRSTRNQQYSKSLPALDLPVLQTVGTVRIGQLKKYLAKQLPPPPAATSDADTTIVWSHIQHQPLSSVEILCHDVPLGNELSVTFVLKTVWVDEGTKPLALTYRLAGE